MHLAAHPAVVRVTVAALRGSAPREPGATLLVDASGTVGTIGGGRLEWHAIGAAREWLLAAGAAPVRIEELVLGAELGQCCGGRVELWLERLTRDDLPWLRRMARQWRARGAGDSRDRPATHGGRGSEIGADVGGAGGDGTVRSGILALATDFARGVVSHRLLHAPFAAPGVQLRRSEGRVTLIEAANSQRPRLWIFGAGHVGQALVRLLAELALFEITWIDARAQLLPNHPSEYVTVHVCAEPARLIAAAPAGARYVVLTHDHALDYELCRAILLRGDSAWLGLIGSASKAARFRSRLLRSGIAAETLAGLTCPIGVAGIASKLPAAIAVAVAAQLLQQLDEPATRRADAPTRADNSPAIGTGPQAPRPANRPPASAAGPQAPSAHARLPPAQLAVDELAPCSTACESCGTARRTPP